MKFKRDNLENLEYIYISIIFERDKKRSNNRGNATEVDMKINGRGKLGIEDARSKVARNACDIQRVSGKCSPGTSEQQFFFPNNLECISVCLEYNKRGKILVGHRFKTIAQTASQEKCKREFYKTLSKVHDTLRPIDTFVFSSYFSKKKTEEQLARSIERTEEKNYIFVSFEMVEVKIK